MSDMQTVGNKDGFRRTSPTQAYADKAAMSFETIGQIDSDADLRFDLAGRAYNPLVDAAMPLFGLAIRLRDMDKIENADPLYHDIRDQITALDEKVRPHGYEASVIMAYRYALCTFVDEAIMQSSWGSQSSWGQRSLLSVFHKETWGGEKFFTVLARMLMDPPRYRDVLEFKYFCLCFGFKGQYGVRHDQIEALQSHITKLHRVLRGMRGETPALLENAEKNVAKRQYSIGRQWSWWVPWLVVTVTLLAIYAIYALKLNETTREVLQALDTILRR